MFSPKKNHKFSTFKILLSIYLIIQVLSESSYVKYEWINILLYSFRLGVLVFFSIYVFFQLKLKLNKLFPIMVCFVSILINMFFSEGGYAILYIIIIVLAYSISQIEINDLLRLVISVSIFAELIVIVSSLIGVIDNEVVYRELSSSNGSFFQGIYTRYYLGFLNFNQLAHAYFDILILIVFLKGERIKLADCIVLITVGFVIYEVSNCRLEFLLEMVIVFSIIILKFCKKSSKPKIVHQKGKRCLWCIVPCLSVFSFVVAYSFDFSNYFFVVLNDVFSNRLYWSQLILQYYGESTFTFWGNGKSAGNTYEELGYIIDSGYIKEVIQRGVIISAIFVCIWSKLVNYAQKAGNFYLMVCILSIVVANAVNETFISPRLIPIYCLFFSVYYNHRQKNMFKFQHDH